MLSFAMHKSVAYTSGASNKALAQKLVCRRLTRCRSGAVDPGSAASGDKKVLLVCIMLLGLFEDEQCNE